MQKKICEVCESWTGCKGRGYSKCKTWRDMFHRRWRQLMTPAEVEEQEERMKREAAEQEKQRTHLEDMLRDAAPWKYRREEADERETISVTDT